MSRTIVSLVDPTIPGVSVRDLATRAVDAVHLNSAAEDSFASRHTDFAIRRSLSRLDSEILQDIGLDRAMA